MRICGIDPGLDKTGYGLVELVDGQLKFVEAGVIRSLPKDSLSDRLKEIHSELSTLLKRLKPDCVSLEEIYSHYEHPATSVLMGHARGVILLAAGQAGLPVASYKPAHIKKAVTGRGHATKEQIRQMVTGLLGQSFDGPDDVTDALAIAMTHVHTLKVPVSAGGNFK